MLKIINNEKTFLLLLSFILGLGVMFFIKHDKVNDVPAQEWQIINPQLIQNIERFIDSTNDDSDVKMILASISAIKSQTVSI